MAWGKTYWKFLMTLRLGSSCSGNTYNGSVTNLREASPVLAYAGGPSLAAALSIRWVVWVGADHPTTSGCGLRDVAGHCNAHSAKSVLDSAAGVWRGEMSRLVCDMTGVLAVLVKFVQILAMYNVSCRK